MSRKDSINHLSKFQDDSNGLYFNSVMTEVVGNEKRMFDPEPDDITSLISDIKETASVDASGFVDRGRKINKSIFRFRLLNPVYSSRKTTFELRKQVDLEFLHFDSNYQGDPQNISYAQDFLAKKCDNNTKLVGFVHGQTLNNGKVNYWMFRQDKLKRKNIDAESVANFVKELIDGKTFLGQNVYLREGTPNNYNGIFQELVISLSSANDAGKLGSLNLNLGTLKTTTRAIYAPPVEIVLPEMVVEPGNENINGIIENIQSNMKEE